MNNPYYSADGGRGVGVMSGAAIGPAMVAGGFTGLRYYDKNTRGYINKQVKDKMKGIASEHLDRINVLKEAEKEMSRRNSVGNQSTNNQAKSNSQNQTNNRTVIEINPEELIRMDNDVGRERSASSASRYTGREAVGREAVGSRVQHALPSGQSGGSFGGEIDIYGRNQNIANNNVTNQRNRSNSGSRRNQSTRTETAGNQSTRTQNRVVIDAEFSEIPTQSNNARTSNTRTSDVQGNVRSRRVIQENIMRGKMNKAASDYKEKLNNHRSSWVGKAARSDWTNFRKMKGIAGIAGGAVVGGIIGGMLDDPNK